jgi:hypothetical protein
LSINGEVFFSKTVDSAKKFNFDKLADGIAESIEFVREKICTGKEGPLFNDSIIQEAIKCQPAAIVSSLLIDKSIAKR